MMLFKCYVTIFLEIYCLKQKLVGLTLSSSDQTYFPITVWEAGYLLSDYLILDGARMVIFGSCSIGFFPMYEQCVCLFDIFLHHVFYFATGIIMKNMWKKNSQTQLRYRPYERRS